MTVPESPTPVLEPAPKKNNTTTWIIVAVVAVLLVCCLLVVGVVVAGTLYFRINSRSTGIPLPAPFLSTPNPVSPNATPAVSNGPLKVESFDPTNSNFPALPDLVPAWKGLTQPGSQDWSVTVQPTQSVVILLGWCTTTPQILQQNDQQIKWSLTVDGQPVDVTTLFPLSQQVNNQVCQSYSGLIRQWTGTTHKIVTTMSVAQKINDGTSDYPAGDYTDVYTVTVSH